MKKAIKFFEEEITRLENAPKINGCEMTDEWAEQIEICKTAKFAIEKQIPKKPKIYKAGFYCSNCGILIGLVRNETDFCKKCGQSVDWGDAK